MSTHKAKCEKCSYRANFSSPLRSYEIPGGKTVTIETTFVWCSACRAVQWGESLPVLTDLEREYEASRTSELEARIARRRGRSSGPHCLQCGSMEITSLVPSKTRRGYDKWTLAEHPGCGGPIIVLKQQVLALNRQWFRYTPEGLKKQAYEMFAHKGAVPIDS